MTPASILRIAAPLVREAVLDAFAVLLPVSCSGCGRADRSLCPRCVTALSPRPVPVRDAGAGPPVWASLDYSGVARAVLIAYKDGGRTDAVAPLARALRASVAAALTAVPPPSRAGGVVLVTIPSTRAAFRRRGYHPTAAVLRRAGLSPRAVRRALRLTRQGSDQAGLTGEQRMRNRAGSLVASPKLAARSCLIVDDIVTSGATVREAARAIEDVGGIVVGAAAIAHTALRRAHRQAGDSHSERPADPPRLPVHFDARRHYGSRKGVDDPPFVIRARDTSDQGGRNGHQHRRTKPGHH
ncbi:ComF family protein [Leifsonia sp. NPDC058230]|uniref:ComF family protein n=1 Tax=Leifsonia sp. NPDC058230 TaxID=3346391 RepID=UPI0036D852EA